MNRNPTTCREVAVGDRSTAERNRLVEEHLPLVGRLARRFSRASEELEDLVQVGAIGLINAAGRFDPQRGCPFEAYAIPTVLGEMNRHLRDRAALVRGPRRSPAAAATTVSLGAPFTGNRMLRIDTGNGYGEFDVPAPDVWGDEDDRICVEMALDALDERTRRVLTRRFFDDRTQREIAGEIGVSQVQVSRLITNALSRLREELDDRLGCARR